MNPINQPDLNQAHGQHLDGETLSAFLEQQLPESERDQALAHLATCSHCRQITYLAQQAADAEFNFQTELLVDQAVAKQTRHANQTKWSFPTLPTIRANWQYATLAAAACLAFVAASLWLYPHPHPDQSHVSAPIPTQTPQQQAALRQPISPQSELKPAQQSESRSKAQPIPGPVSRTRPIPSPPRFPSGPSTPNAASASFGVTQSFVALPPAAAPALPTTMAAAKAQIAPGIANIEGSVHDSSGAAIPNAHVELTETATNLHQETSTSTTGDYAFTHLNPGPYRIDVSAPGFEHLIRNATINQTVDETAAQAANVANAANIDLTLNPGSASETVTVAAEAAPLQSQTENQAEARNTPTVNTTISAQQIQPLPLEARNSIEFKKSKAAGSTATSAGARTATASHGVSAGFAARQGAFAKRADANQLAANALQQPLPNGQKPLATAATSNLLLAIDSTGALQLSSDAGKTWQPIPQQWTGRAVSLRVRSTPAAQNALDSLTDSPTGSLSDANQATPPATRQTPEPPPAQFEIITDEHATYVSTDGHIWKPK